MKKPWSGRFTHKTSEAVELFTESISCDKRLWNSDIKGSMAHAKMLGKQGIISKKDAEAIIKGLKEIADDIRSGKFRWNKRLEDIHMNIEAVLIKKIGSKGKKLHSARSRNDQVSVDLRLYLKEETQSILSIISKLQKIIVRVSERQMNTIMPGYTHLQKAQPVLLSHHLLAYVEMLQRDKNRFEDTLKRIDVLPLGSCALSGTALPIDRTYVAKILGFKAVSGNSIDAVSDRDFTIEFCSCASLLMMHLSRLAEEIIIWSTDEFGFLEIPDEYATGSSIMPQKKNPDILELIRGKTGRVYGNLVSLLTMMKGLPLAYNRDMQEDKLPVFDTGDTLKSCLHILIDLLPKLKFHAKRMLEGAHGGFTTATDLVEYLVKKGIPFREAHEITGKIVRDCLENKKQLQSLTLNELKKYSPRITKDIYSVLKPVASVESHSSYGGTSSSEVKRQIKRYKRILT